MLLCLCIWSNFTLKLLSPFAFIWLHCLFLWVFYIKYTQCKIKVVQMNSLNTSLKAKHIDWYSQDPEWLKVPALDTSSFVCEIMLRKS